MDGQWWNVSRSTTVFTLSISQERTTSSLMAHLKLQTKLGWLTLSDDACTIQSHCG